MEAVRPKKKNKKRTQVKKEEETVVESLKIEENNVEKISTIVEEEIPADPVQMEIAGSSEVISPGSEILRLEEQQTDVSHQQLSEPEIPFVRKSEPISVAQLNVEASSSPTVCAKLYPEFGELQTEETTVTIRSPISRMRKSSVMILPPYTEAQLRSFYSNAELELCERFTDDFVQRELDKSFGDTEWSSLLEAYWSAFSKYEDAQHEIKNLDSQWDNHAESVWTLNQKIVTHKGKCEEGKDAEGTAKYPVAQFNTEVAEKLKATVDTLKDAHCEKSTRCNYELQVAKLRCQSYIDQLLSESVILFENFSIHPAAPPSVDFSTCEAFVELRNKVTFCLSVSFGFLRRSGLPGEIERKIRRWTEVLVSVSIRIASPTDHFYLLNQLLRCPANVGEWASDFIQPLQQQVSDVQAKLCIDHFVALLSLLLSPIRQREEFLKQLIQHELSSKDTAWTVVTNDGDEDEEGYMMQVQETDLLLFLNQFSFDRLFALFLQSQCSSSTGALSESQILCLFAFELTLLKILYEGIHSYGLPRYCGFCKQLGYVMRQTVQYVGEYWLECRTRLVNQGFPFDKISRLQQEFDRLFFRSVSYIISARNLGVWQFIVDLPFGSVSIDFLWKVLYILIEGRELDRQAVLSTTTESLIEELMDESQLDLVLSDMAEMDAVYLMTALSNMASAASDLKFVTAVSDKLFKTAFVTPNGREIFYKTGRNCLGVICQRHKLLIGILLKRIDTNAESLGRFAMEVLSEAPLHEWNVGLNELDVLRTWLLMDTKSLLGNLARKILSSLTYGSHTKETDTAVVSGSAQFYIAEIVSESHQKHVHQVPKHDQTFSLFCWELLTALELQNCYQVRQKCLSSMLITNGLVAKDTSAMYVALCCLFGQDVEGFLQEGLEMLQTLVKFYLYKPAIIVSLKVLMIHTRAVSLTQSPKFLAILNQLVHADETYSQYVKSFIVTEFPGLHTTLIGSFLFEQVMLKEFIPISEVDPFCATLTQLLLKCGKKQQWNKDKNVCYLLNLLVRLCFHFEPNLVLVKRVYTEELKSLVNGDSKSSGKGLWGWFSSNNTQLMSDSDFGEFPWLAFVCISVEEAMLSDSINNLELTALRNPSHSLQKLLKEVDKSVSLSLEKLPIHRWLHFINVLDPSHLLVVIVCQKILQYCLRRVVTDDPALPKTNLGSTYYNCAQLQPKFTKLRSFIPEASGKVATKTSEVLKAMLSWLEDKRLYSSYTNLAALTDVPSPHRLQQLVNGEVDLWLDLLEFDQLRIESEQLGKQFGKLSSLSQFWRSASINKSDVEASASRLGPNASLRRLLDRLRTAPLKTVSPPEWSISSDVLPMEPDSVLWDVGRTIELVRKDMEIIVKAARKYGDIVSTMISLDLDFMEDMGNLYQKMQTHVPVTLKCNAGILQTCRAPSCVKIPVMTSKINVGVKEKITKNRQSYNDQILQLSRLLSLETVRGAAHTSNLVSRLILLSKFRDSANDVILQTTGVSLFHHFLQTLSSTVLQFPASNSLLISLLEILGTAFIVGNPTQVETIFNLICQNPGYDRFLVSLLDPQCADNLTYVGLYRQLGEICGQKDRKISNQLLLSLLSKFSIDKFILFASFGEVQKVANVSYNQLVNPSIAAELYQCYLSHWLSCFGYQFPSMLEFCFQQILVGCEKQNIQFDLLNEVLLKLGINNEQTQESLVITVYDCERLISLLTYCFSTVRNFGDTLVGPNIYTKLGQYVNFFAPLMEFLMQRAMVERKDNSQAVTNCWDEIIRLYGPWLEPNVNVVPSVSVWTVDEITIAEAFVRGFVVSLATLQKMFGATCIPSPLAICWMYYSNRIAVIRSPHVYGVFHRQLLTLPWQDLCPSIDILDSFHRKLSSDNSLSNGFVTDVIVRIPWVRRDYELYYNSPDRQMCRWLLFDSVCRCVCVAENYSNCKASFPKLLEELQAIPWLDMPQHKVCETFEFLISNLDCRSILMEEDTTEAVFIRFLRFAVGFLPNYDATVIQARTARLFVKLFTSCMVGCCARSQPPVTDRICDLLLCLIADVELITRTVIDTTISTDIADLLLQELVVFWNHCSDASCLDQSMTTVLQWIAKYPDAKTVVPLMKQASVLWVDFSKLTVFLESSLNSYFSTGETASSLMLVSTLRQQTHLVPKILNESARTGCFLVLSLLLKQQLVSCTRLSEETDVLRQVLTVLTAAKTAVFDESKIILLIKLACVVIVRHYEFGAKPETVYPILKETMGLLDYFAQEPSGFLSAFGLSRKQIYTSRFKLICHITLGFISQQIIDDKSVRLDPNIPVLHSRMSLIKSLKRDKQFLKFTEVLDKISEYFNNAEKHLGNLNELLTLMFSLLQMENFLTDPY